MLDRKHVRIVCPLVTPSHDYYLANPRQKTNCGGCAVRHCDNDTRTKIFKPQSLYIYIFSEDTYLYNDFIEDILLKNNYFIDLLI